MIIQHIQHSCSKKHCIKQDLQHVSTCSTFLQFRANFVLKMLLSAEMLNMLNHVGDLVWKMCFFRGNVEYVEYVEWFGNLEAPLLIGSKNIQHIQHFCRKKHFFQTRSPTWFKNWTYLQIRANFVQQMLLSAEMLNMLNAFGTYKLHCLQVPKEFNIFNILNISAVISIFANTISNMIQHIQHFCRKKHFSNKYEIPYINVLKMHISAVSSPFEMKRNLFLQK